MPGRPRRRRINGAEPDSPDGTGVDDRQIHYELSAPPGVSQTTVVASRTDSDSTVEVFVVRIGANGLIVDQTDRNPNEEGHQVRLSDTGDTLVIVRVTSADGLGQRVYLALINKSSWSPSTQVRDARAPRALAARDAIRSSHPTLTALSVSDGELAPSFVATTRDYTVTVEREVSEVTVAFAASSGAQAAVTMPTADADTVLDGYQVALGEPGSETSIVVVASADDQMTGYTIKVTRLTTSRGFKYIEAGWSHACAIRMDGTLVCWGYDTPAIHQEGIDYEQSLGPVLEIAAEKYQTCALLPDGETRCWGDKRGAPDLSGEGTMTQQSGAGPLVHAFTGYHGCRLLAAGSADCPGAQPPTSLKAGP